MTQSEKPPLSIADLKQRRPDLFESPDFWRSGLDDVAGAAAATRGEVSVLGRSAGGREIPAFAYGTFEPQDPTATISSAMGSDRPEAFFDPSKRTRPALVLVGSIHGGETEGIAVCLNLISVMESGRDLMGREQPRLADLLGQVRLVVIPCLNPDGRERAAVSHLNGAEIDHLYLVQQGVMQNGELLRGRQVKEIQPIPPGLVRSMGGYYNDAGVNPQHDDFFGPSLCPENAALRDLFRREIPDGFLTLHAHGGHTSLTSPDAYVSPGYRRKQSEAAFYILSRLASEGIEVMDPGRSTGPAWSFNFQTYFHHAAGALPLLCELPHGLRQRPCPLDRIIDAGLTVVEAWGDFALRFGLRPKHMDFYGTPPPA